MKNTTIKSHKSVSEKYSQCCYTLNLIKMCNDNIQPAAAGWVSHCYFNPISYYAVLL
jgi:hypothetical protein